MAVWKARPSDCVAATVSPEAVAEYGAPARLIGVLTELDLGAVTIDDPDQGEWCLPRNQVSLARPFVVPTAPRWIRLADDSYRVSWPGADSEGELFADAVLDVGGHRSDGFWDVPLSGGFVIRALAEHWGFDWDDETATLATVMTDWTLDHYVRSTNAVEAPRRHTRYRKAA